MLTIISNLALSHSLNQFVIQEQQQPVKANLSLFASAENTTQQQGTEKSVSLKEKGAIISTKLKQTAQNTNHLREQDPSADKTCINSKAETQVIKEHIGTRPEARESVQTLKVKTISSEKLEVKLSYILLRAQCLMGLLLIITITIIIIMIVVVLAAKLIFAG